MSDEIISEVHAIKDALGAKYADDANQEDPMHREVERVSGLVPADIDGRSVYREHLVKKHR